jgi:MPBQ/MSBQ methyltransferase
MGRGAAAVRPPEPLPRLQLRSGPARPVATYYSETFADYLLWSRRLNMHFGFWRPGINPVDREAMLEQMNREVIARLHLDRWPRPVVIDMGCGVGTGTRSVARVFPGSRPVGLTLVRWQAANARRWAAREGERCPPIVVGDYLQAPVRTGVADAAFAIESSCYAPGLSKRGLLAEMARITRRGGRVVVADAMLKRRRASSPVSRAAHYGLCQAWALDTLGHIGSFVDGLHGVGFEDISVEDISVNVLPSSVHAPLVTARFAMDAMRSLAAGGAVSPARVRNALVTVPLMVFAADPTAAGYYMVSATRR